MNRCGDQTKTSTSVGCEGLEARELEDRMGAKLFRRAGNTMVPTEAGLTLRPLSGQTKTWRLSADQRSRLIGGTWVMPLETMRDRYWHNMATRIQRMWRAYLAYRAESAIRIGETTQRFPDGIRFAILERADKQ